MEGDNAAAVLHFASFYEKRESARLALFYPKRQGDVNKKHLVWFGNLFLFSYVKKAPPNAMITLTEMRVSMWKMRPMWIGLYSLLVMCTNLPFSRCS